MCKSCRKPCNNIIEHIKKVHGFSESFVFITEKRKCFVAKGLSTLFNRLARDSSIVRTKTHRNRYDVMSSHGLRKFFDTTLKLNHQIQAVQTPAQENQVLQYLSKTSFC